MNPGNGSARSTRFECTGISLSHIFPSQTVIFTEMKGCTSVTSWRCIGGLYQPAFFRNKRACYHLVTAGMLGGNHTGTTPGCTVIGTRTHDHSQCFPGSGSLHTVHVNQCSVIIQQGRTCHIPVWYPEEFTRFGPFGCPRLQSALKNYHFPTRLLVAGKPDSHQIAIIAPTDSRTMVMFIERNARRAVRSIYINKRFGKERGFRRSSPVILLLGNCFLQSWFKGWKWLTLRHVSLHDTESGQPVFILRQHGHTVCRTQEAFRCAMASAACHLV